MHRPVPVKYRLDIHCNRKLLLLVVVLLPVFIKAGFWQLDRLAYKKTVKEKFLRSENLPAVSYPVSDVSCYTRVKVEGKVLPGYWLLDNQMHEGQVGYEVLQAIEITNGQRVETLPVSVGWIKGHYDKSVLPTVNTLSGDIDLTGMLYPVPQNIFVNDQGVSVDAKVIPALDRDVIKKIMPEHHSKWLLRVNGDLHPVEGLTYPDYRPNFRHERHLAYAVQWFSFAAILMVLFLWQSVSLIRIPLRSVEAEEKYAE